MKLSLKSARINKELSRPQVIKLLAEKDIKITVNTLASYESKTTQPNITTGLALASIYGVAVDDIIFM